MKLNRAQGAVWALLASNEDAPRSAFKRLHIEERDSALCGRRPGALSETCFRGRLGALPPSQCPSVESAKLVGVSFR